jgi:hypothetical protein
MPPMANVHLYVLISQELGYGMPPGFMLLEIRDKENTETEGSKGEVKACNVNFYFMAKQMRIANAFIYSIGTKTLQKLVLHRYLCLF